MSKGGSKTRLPAGLDALSLIQAKGARQSAGVRSTIFNQVTEALRTGGVKAHIPAIQQAISSARSASSAQRTQTAEQLATRNIGGPFAARTLAQLAQAGRQQEAEIPLQVTQQFLKSAPTLGQVGYPGAPVTGVAGSSRSDTASPAIGAGAQVASALATALLTRPGR